MRKADELQTKIRYSDHGYENKVKNEYCERDDNNIFNDVGSRSKALNNKSDPIFQTKINPQKGQSKSIFINQNLN